MMPRPRKVIENMRAYEEEADVPVNLMANTNLFPANPALARATACAKELRFGDYPSLTSAPLRVIAAKHYGVPEDGIVTGNGSNELIDVIIRTFAEAGDRVAYHPPTFSMIPVFVQSNGAEPAPVPLREGWKLDVDGLLEQDAKVTFVVTPNNPTGNAFPREDVERVVRESRGVVVVDEAYHEFTTAPSFARDLDRHPNLVVLRTLSKAHGLAALRVGFALANPGLAREISKVRGPFRLNAFSEAVAGLALEGDDYAEDVRDRVLEERPRYAETLQARGFDVFPSDANFLLARAPVDARTLAERLLDEGVAVRSFRGDLAPYIRVTVGPAEAREALEAALDKVLPKLQEVRS